MVKVFPIRVVIIIFVAVAAVAACVVGVVVIAPCKICAVLLQGFNSYQIRDDLGIIILPIRRFVCFFSERNVESLAYLSGVVADGTEITDIFRIVVQ
jgi:hypothetical protein